MPRYRAPAAAAEGEHRDRGSRFRSFVLPVAGEEEARAALAALARRFPDATHHCWAWRLGDPPRARSADAGEPAGTAGAPILRALAGAGLSDVLAVVVRWFGGTKLGKGGLARAYAAATRAALADLQVVERVPTLELTVAVPYERLGAVQRLVHPPEVELRAADYGGTAHLRLVVHAERQEALRAALAALGLAAEEAPGARIR
ncbi:MAG TPA: YigZ family protein [Thermoanaerobaculia bacterium]